MGKAWKARERQVARFFGAERNPLSGGNGKHTRSDSLSDALFIETKLRAKHTAVTLWDKTKAQAEREGKTPVVCLAEKHRPGFWIMVHADNLAEIVEEIKRRGSEDGRRE